ncbi:MAG: zf-HC2 domain-containing protein [Acidobacteria bacterium]|nr:zf-HC2 domain-containing protein [Acidobacteriota bacterium]
MIDHLSAQLMERFRARQLDSQELQAVAQHLAVCEACRAAIQQSSATNAAIHFLRADLQRQDLASAHLVYEQLAAYVDAALNTAEGAIVKQHLEVCADCANQVRELSLLKENLQSYPNLQPQQAAATTIASSPSNAAPSIADAVSLSASVTNRLVKFAPRVWQNGSAFFRSKPMALALTTVLLAILVAGFFMLRSHDQQHSVTAINNSTSPSATYSANQSATPPENNSEAIAPDDSTNSGAPTPPAKPASPDHDHRLKAETPNRQAKNPYALGASSPLASVYAKAIKQALANQALALPEASRQLIGQRSNLMSNQVDGEAFALLTPVGTVIQNDRPTFRWQALDGATAYTVFVLDSNFQVIVKSAPLTGTSWTAPQALKRGALYAWQVTANQNGKTLTAPTAPLPEARFKILAQANSDELQRLTKERATSHLGLAVIYAHQGLLDEAEDELQMAIKQNQNAATAKKLLHSLKSMRR